MTNYLLKRLSKPTDRIFAPGVEWLKYMAYRVDIKKGKIKLFDDDDNLIIDIDIDKEDEHFEFINSDTDTTLYSN